LCELTLMSCTSSTLNQKKQRKLQCDCQLKMFQSALILTPVTWKLSIQLYVKTWRTGPLNQILSSAR